MWGQIAPLDIYRSCHYFWTNQIRQSKEFFKCDGIPQRTNMNHHLNQTLFSNLIIIYLVIIVIVIIAII